MDNSMATRMLNRREVIAKEICTGKVDSRIHIFSYGFSNNTTDSKVNAN